MSESNQEDINILDMCDDIAKDIKSGNLEAALICLEMLKLELKLLP